MTSIIEVNLRRLEVYITGPVRPSLPRAKTVAVGATASLTDYRQLLVMSGCVRGHMCMCVCLWCGYRQCSGLSPSKSSLHD